MLDRINTQLMLENHGSLKYGKVILQTSKLVAKIQIISDQITTDRAIVLYLFLHPYLTLF